MGTFRHSDVSGFVEKNAEVEAYHSGRIIQYSDSGVKSLKWWIASFFIKNVR